MLKTRRLSKFILTAATLAAVALLVYVSDKGGMKFAGYSTKDTTAKIEIFSGRVEVQLPESVSWLEAKESQVILAGTKIRTSEGGSAQITYPSGTITSIDDNSEVTLETYDQDPQSISVYLTKGRVWSSIIKLLGGESYQTESKNMVATVRGTSYVHAILSDGSDQIITTESTVQAACTRNQAAKVNVDKDNMLLSNCKTNLSPTKTPTNLLGDNWLQNNLKNESKRREKLEKENDVEEEENSGGSKEKKGIIEKIFNNDVTKDDESEIEIEDEVKEEDKKETEDEEGSVSGSSSRSKSQKSESEVTPAPTPEASPTPTL